MTTTKLRVAATGIAALLGLGLAAGPSAATTEVVPSHAGHDHSAGDDAKSDKGEGKAKGKGKGKNAQKAGKKKGKGKAAHDHGGHSH